MSFPKIATTLLFASWLSGAAYAAAADPGVTTGAASYPGTVTISNEDTPATYLAFVVTLYNNGGSSVRLANATGTVTALKTSGLTAPVVNAFASDPNCLFTPRAELDGFSFSCNFTVSAATTAAGGTADYVIAVEVPKYSALASSSPQEIVFNATTSFREGGSTTSSPASLSYLQSSLSTLVAPQSPTSVKSAIVKGGNRSLYTGNNIPKSDDKQTTSVTVDALDKLDTTSPLSFIKVEITETAAADAEAVSCANSRTFKTCFKTQLLAQDDKANHVRYKWGSYLTQVIRSNTDNHQPGNPKNFIWYYVSDAEVQSTINGNTSTDFCPKNPLTGLVAPNFTIVNGEPVATGVPCLVSPPVCYKKGDTLDGVVLQNGVCEWRFINDRNGLIKGYF